MKRFVARLWGDESGAIVSSEIMLVASILVIGIIAGLTSLRDAVVTELADVGQALANVDQSYSFNGTSGHHVFTSGGYFVDLLDFCDTPATLTDATNSKCVAICSSALHPVGTDGSDASGN